MIETLELAYDPGGFQLNIHLRRRSEEGRWANRRRIRGVADAFPSVPTYIPLAETLVEARSKSRKKMENWNWTILFGNLIKLKISKRGEGCDRSLESVNCSGFELNTRLWKGLFKTNKKYISVIKYLRNVILQYFLTEVNFKYHFMQSEKQKYIKK